MSFLTLPAYAKINLALSIEGRRPDGYHLLRTVMQSIDLADTVRVEVLPDSGIELTVSEPEIPTDRKNTAYRAAEAFLQAAGCDRSVRIAIEKRIPSQAGLGGASADAAAVLRALDQLVGPVGEEPLLEIAAKIGADVPFCLCGGTRLCEGIGERMTVLPDLPTLWVVLCKPPFGVSTPAAFAAYDALLSPPRVEVDALCTAIAQGDRAQIGACCGNALEAVVDRPEIAKCKAALRKAGALGAAMTGSGSVIYGLFADEASAVAAAEKAAEFGRTFCVQTHA